MAVLLFLPVGALAVWPEQPQAQSAGTPVPGFKVDPFWPKPLPSPKDAAGLAHQWVTGEVGASCIDSHDHVITVNRGFRQGGLLAQEGTQSIPAPPIILYDTDGNIAGSWGDPSLNADGTSVVLPNSVHGCFADYEDNIWIAGNGDGVVQKWTHDGRKMLLQIGTKGVCDGPPTRKPPYQTCGEPGSNTSQTLLNNPADIAVDPNPDPVTGERGSVYIADGYGNHRVVVFDARGKFLRQWGSSGSGPGQFVATGGGHPHCVVLGKDGTVYACDRGQNRIHAYDRTGVLKRSIAVDPPDQMMATSRADDLVLSPDETYMYVVDLGSDKVWILDRASGALVGGIGRAGHMAGEFTFPHTAVTDSRGNLYVAETVGGRRHQKFLKVGGS
jgi:DNA-binding beta-propeller fold protein YncE